jgi:hypothetical protein
MGYSLFWLAVKGKALPDLLAQFELVPTGETERSGESDIFSAELPDGWNVIHWNKGDLPSNSEFAIASAGCEAIFCFLEEHVMVSFSSGWENGVELWSVHHDCSARKDLFIKGCPPQPFNDIRARLEAEQKQHNATKPPRRERVDFIFNIPVDLAEAITGYSHIQDFPGDIPGVAFSVLKSVKKPKASFFRRIFQK